jgi:hypothetical protein
MHVSGNTEYYYLPLVANVLEGFGLDLATIDSDIEIRLHPASDGPLNGALSAGADPQLTELAGIFGEHAPDVISQNATNRFMAKHVKVHNYLDTQQYVIPSRQMVASTTYEFDLDQFDHCSAALVLHVSADNVSNTLGTSGNFHNLSGGTLDILGVSGDSMLGKGRAIQIDYLKDIIVQQQFGTSFIRTNGVHVIPFGDFGAALHGKMDGYHKFDGSKCRLQLTTPALWFTDDYKITIYSLYFREIHQNGSDLAVQDCM